MKHHASTGIVFQVRCVATCTDGTYACSVAKDVLLDPPDVDKTIPYDKLTPEIVLGWVKNSLGGDEAFLAIEDELKAKLTGPNTIASGLPWL